MSTNDSRDVAGKKCKTVFQNHFGNHMNNAVAHRLVYPCSLDELDKFLILLNQFLLYSYQRLVNFVTHCQKLQNLSHDEILALASFLGKMQ